MTTQVVGTMRRSRIGGALVAVIFVFAVFVLANEASSALSTGTVPRVQAPPFHVSLSPKEMKDLSRGATLPVGCRIRYGCRPGKGSNAEPLNGSHIPIGCRIKFGCH